MGQRRLSSSGRLPDKSGHRRVYHEREPSNDGADPRRPSDLVGQELSFITKFVVEEAALAWLEGLGYAVLHDPDIAVGELRTRRTSW